MCIRSMGITIDYVYIQKKSPNIILHIQVMILKSVYLHKLILNKTIIVETLNHNGSSSDSVTFVLSRENYVQHTSLT